jgi:hypothetical protein
MRMDEGSDNNAKGSVIAIRDTDYFSSGIVCVEWCRFNNCSTQTADGGVWIILIQHLLFCLFY